MDETAQKLERVQWARAYGKLCASDGYRAEIFIATVDNRRAYAKPSFTQKFAAAAAILGNGRVAKYAFHFV
jgi:hypothetical protein